MVEQRYNLNANLGVQVAVAVSQPEAAAGTGRFIPVVVEGGTTGHEADAAALGSDSDDDVALGTLATRQMETMRQA